MPAGANFEGCGEPPREVVTRALMKDRMMHPTGGGSCVMTRAKGLSPVSNKKRRILSWEEFNRLTVEQKDALKGPVEFIRKDGSHEFADWVGFGWITVERASNAPTVVMDKPRRKRA